MGSEDDLSTGKSTFMCELIRTNKIIRSIHSRSLVIIDELGRGTSTHDGQAIAQATLDYLIRSIGCCTLFITHFPQIAQVVEENYPQQAFNSHMSYFEMETNEEGDDSNDNTPEIVFLYKIVRNTLVFSCFL
jgi:DNA mismatch repair protein MSH3